MQGRSKRLPVACARSPVEPYGEHPMVPERCHEQLLVLTGSQPLEGRAWAGGGSGRQVSVEWMSVVIVELI